uniref:Fluoride-specific ion channel FluC n=1 Tax=Acidobacterium capsulatum TaxID=33075 RepID=A0A7V4XUS4_9BACT
MKYLWVALGGALGALARYTVGVWIYERLGTRFPYGTFAINVTGCFLIGLALTVLDAHMDLSPAWRLAIPTGFIGAYTTFSTFEYETLRAAQQGQMGTAVLYFGSSLALGILAVWLGMVAGNRIVA